MNRTMRRQNRVEAMYKTIHGLQYAYKNAIHDCILKDVNVNEDEAVNKAYERLNYVATELAQAQYTENCAKQDAKSWLAFCDCLAKAGLMYSTAYWEAHSAFHGQRYWAILSSKERKMR